MHNTDSMNLQKMDLQQVDLQKIDLQKIISQLSVRLAFNQLKIVTVESCTGGGIGKALTDLAGSSEWFAGGLITYTNESKHRLAKVPLDQIQHYGAVSTQVVEYMAIGAMQYFDDCVSVAVSGIAGPGGGSEEKPIGTVCIATCLPDGLDNKKHHTNAKCYHFDGDRTAIREQSIKQALLMVLQTTEKKGN